MIFALSCCGAARVWPRADGPGCLGERTQRREGGALPLDLHKRVSVPSWREVPAKRDPVTGLAATAELVVEYKVRLNLGEPIAKNQDSPDCIDQYHRFSHFTNMNAALRSCLRDTPLEARLPPLPPKSWGLNGYTEGKDFLENRRKSLEQYMQGVLMDPGISGSCNPYILGMFALLRPLRCERRHSSCSSSSSPV